MSALDDERSYALWTARKTTRLKRKTLDCGHSNLGEVSIHLWCDFLACPGCADVEHDCSAYAGVKSGTEEVSEPLEAAAPLDAWTAAMSNWIRPVDGAAPAAVCRGCHRIALVLPDAKLCGPCEAGPKCSAERSAAEWGGTAVCFRPPGHDGVHESVEGRAWTDQPPPVEALRPGAEPIFTATDQLYTAPPPENTLEVLQAGGYRACMDRLEPHVDAVVEPDPDVHSRPFKFTDLYRALRARARRGGTKS